ncbi:MAG: SRPBCC domain-containing protein [Chlorobiaceae bacterium]|nr:SRPBCC domain-containing protein [Chlorobiaceae bacterium]
MKTFRTEVSINAPQERVWSVLADFGKYRSWNPFLRRISGRQAFNEKLRITVKLPSFPSVRIEARIDTLVYGEKIGWHAVFFKGLLNARHWFELHQVDSHTTLLIHTEEFTGLFSGLVLDTLSGAFCKGYARMNHALKHESEKG